MDTSTIITIVMIAVCGVIAAVLIIGAAVHDSKKTFVCGNCGHEFTRKWYQLMFAAHVNDDVACKCPKCGEKGLKTAKK